MNTHPGKVKTTVIKVKVHKRQVYKSELVIVVKIKGKDVNKPPTPQGKG